MAVSTADAHVQMLVSVVKMATVLEVCSDMPFLWAKRLNAKGIHKEIFFCLQWEVSMA
jgi:hypothetical protein